MDWLDPTGAIHVDPRCRYRRVHLLKNFADDYCNRRRDRTDHLVWIYFISEISVGPHDLGRGVYCSRDLPSVDRHEGAAVPHDGGDGSQNGATADDRH